jgi:2-keto-4-pentenoate hydratase/2-oxohepta-3-ene-1,7-dioic acid hydratase in catechol pathway
MKLGTTRIAGRDTVAVALSQTRGVTLEEAYSLAEFGSAPTSLIEIIEGGAEALAKTASAVSAAKGRAKGFDVESVEWRAPVTRPGKIIGVAFNNKALASMAHKPFKAPMFFLKPSSALTGHNCPIVIGENFGHTVPELELAAIIGRKGRNFSKSDASGHIFGYTIINDVTSVGLKFTLDAVAIDVNPKRERPETFSWRRRRDENDNELYFTYHARSKGCDTFAPMGPWLTTRDEIADPNKLEVNGFLDEEPFVADSTANFQFSIEDVIAEASRYFTLEPGDIIHFGTASRGQGRFERGHLDVNLGAEKGPVVAEIPGLGRLSNPIVKG